MLLPATKKEPLPEWLMNQMALLPWPWVLVLMFHRSAASSCLNSP
jgi:hypothetical protein